MVFWISGFCECKPNPSASDHKLDQLLRILYSQVSSREGLGGGASEQVGGGPGAGSHSNNTTSPGEGYNTLAETFLFFSSLKVYPGAFWHHPERLAVGRMAGFGA